MKYCRLCKEFFQSVDEFNHVISDRHQDVGNTERRKRDKYGEGSPEHVLNAYDGKVITEVGNENGIKRATSEYWIARKASAGTREIRSSKRSVQPVWKIQIQIMRGHPDSD